MSDDERIERLELEVEVLRANNKGLKDKIEELKMQLEVKKIDNKYNQEEASEEMIPRYKIKAKIEECKKDIEIYNNYEENWHKIEVLQSLLEKE